MKNSYLLLLGSALCIGSASLSAQQLVAVAGEDSPAALWALGEVIAGSYESESLKVGQGVLAYADYYGPISIEEHQEAEAVSVWPNPVHDRLNISLRQELIPVLVSITGANGVLAGQFSLNREQEVYNLSHLAAGLYYIRLTDINVNLLATKKIIKL